MSSMHVPPAYSIQRLGQDVIGLVVRQVDLEQLHTLVEHPRDLEASHERQRQNQSAEGRHVGALVLLDVKLLVPQHRAVMVGPRQARRAAPTCRCSRDSRAKAR